KLQLGVAIDDESDDDSCQKKTRDCGFLEGGALGCHLEKRQAEGHEDEAGGLNKGACGDAIHRGSESEEDDDGAREHGVILRCSSALVLECSSARVRPTPGDV